MFVMQATTLGPASPKAPLMALWTSGDGPDDAGA